MKKRKYELKFYKVPEFGQISCIDLMLFYPSHENQFCFSITDDDLMV